MQHYPMTKAKASVASGVKKKHVDGDYKKRRKPVPSEATLAKRSAAKGKALAEREKAVAARALAKTAAATNTAKPKPKSKPKWEMVWMSKDYVQIGKRIVQKKMMRREQGRKCGHWLKKYVTL
jgi:hypothetical protein